MINQNLGSSTVEVSRVALGCMKMAPRLSPDEPLSPQTTNEAIIAFEAALSNGITFFDHADIYGGGACERVFKEVLLALPGVRDQITIATKCGIRGEFYELSQRYIEYAVYQSLDRLGIQYIDLYQLHRPDPLTHPQETASALKKLVADGVVRHVGVSNYYPEQVRALEQYLDGLPLLSNQISISLLRLDPIYEGWDGGDGVLDQCLALGLTPLAYSPLGGSVLSKVDPISAENPRRTVIDAVRAEMAALGQKYDATPGQVAIAWLLKHPAGIVPVVGSNNPEHIAEACGAVNIDLSHEDWYRIWTAAWGRHVP
jgi:predicted oxidoreductase